MRQRKVKNLDEKLGALAEYIVANPEENKGKWREFFGNNKPIYVEIGCGKGQFISKLARENRVGNYIAIEGQDSVALRAAEKAKALTEETDIDNLVVVIKFVNDLTELFDNGEIDGIYLNFSDPWPKDRHDKRRLTHRERIQSYIKVLKQGGFIDVKTDNNDLFEFTLEEFAALELPYSAWTPDLHGHAAHYRQISPMLLGPNEHHILKAADTTTEYEDKFMEQGLPINYVKVEKLW